MMKNSFWMDSMLERMILFILICLSCSFITVFAATLNRSHKPQPSATPAIHITMEYRTFTPAPTNTATISSQADPLTITDTPTRILPSATLPPTKIQPTDTRTPTKVPSTSTLQPSPTKIPSTSTLQPSPTKIPSTSTLQPSPTVTQTATSTASIVIDVVSVLEQYVYIENVGNEAIDLKGWMLVSENGNQACSLGGTIQPKHVLRIWATTGTPGYSCGFADPIWSVAELDPAVLYNPQGEEVSRYP